jgi:uncharacterized protein (PEP-CTERM system associated)
MNARVETRAGAPRLTQAGLPAAIGPTTPRRFTPWRGLGSWLIPGLCAIAAPALAQTVTPLDSGSDSSGGPQLQGPTATLLPPLGADPGDQSLRTNLLNAFGQTPPPPAGQAAGPAWQISPSLTVSEQYTDDANVAAGAYTGPHQGQQTDFITLIQPTLAVSENGERLRVNLNYSPTAEIYAINSDYTQLQERAYGSAQAVLLNDLLYFDLRGNVNQQPVFGGLPTANSVALGPDQRETVSSVSASPYVARSFGGIGTLNAGVGYIYTATDAPDYLNQTIPNPLLPYNYGSSWLATKRIFANFTSGEDYGRFQDSLSSDNNFYDGTGALRNGQRVLLTNDLSYAVNRFVAALGEIGYENLSYPNSGFSYVGGVWAAGVRLTPNAQSTITAEWRYVDGVGAPYIYGSWQVTPRIRAYGGYSEGISNFDQDQQNTLLSGQATSSGAAAAALVAAPLLNAGGYAGGNQSLSRTRRLSASAAFIADRDTVSLSFNWQRSSILGTPLGLPASELQALGIDPAILPYLLKYGVSPFLPPATQAILNQIIQFAQITGEISDNVTGGISWVHQLQPNLTVDTYLGYTESLQAQTVTTRTSAIQFNAGVTKTFNDKLSARLAYTGSYVVGNNYSDGYGGYNLNNDTVTISVTKRF